MKTVIQNRFDAGIANDPRADGNVCRMCSNFDALTNPRKLTPYHDSESGDTDASTSQKQNFAVALRTGTTYSLYALGVKSGAGTAEVLYKDFTALDTNIWSTPSNNQSAGSATSFNLFTYYKKTGLIYGAAGGNRIWAFSPSGSAWDDNIISTNSGTPFSYTNIAEGLVHSKDNILYIPYDNVIAKCDATSGTPVWNTTAASVPTHFKITSICEQGNNIAIMCSPLNGIGGTRVFIWDRNATVVNFEESIDWGDGDGKILHELDGILVGISLYGNNLTRFADRVVFKYWDGVGAKEFLTLEGGTVTQLTQARQRIDNRLFFQMGITLNGSYRAGVWSIGRTANGWSIFHERTFNNDSTFTSSDVLKGFIKVGDYLFQSAVVSSAFDLRKTNDQAAYTATSIYETKVNPGNMDPEDKPKLKKLLGIAVLTERLTGSAQLVVKVKLDGGSWSNPLITHTTSTKNTQGKTDLIVAEVQTTQVADFREIELRLESTGGAVPTAYGYAYDPYKSNIFV